MQKGWKKYLLYSGVIIIIVTGILSLIFAGYSVPESGFGYYTLPNGDFVRGKTFWDWMDLLIIPLVLAGGAFYLNRSERAIERKTIEDRTKLEREIAIDRQQEEALQAYLDRMTDLLLKEKLATSENEEVRNVAKIRTLTVLRGLDAKRKRFVLLFLLEAGLINSVKNTVIGLEGADLTGADLSGAFLFQANLRGADLSNVDFSGAVFDGVNLSKAILHKANLRGMDFEGKIGPGLPTELDEANLSLADLTGALVTTQQLETACSLKGAIMPDGTIHE